MSSPAPGEPAEAWDLLATSNFGLESVVARELEALGMPAKPVATGRVLFRGGPREIARANLWLRAADRVLVRVGQFPARDFGELFDGVTALPWERWIPADFAFPVDGRSVRSQLSSVPACQKIAKKAIVERLRRAHGVTVLPETGPTVRCEVALLKDEVTLTIDTSGDGLHKRGYRRLVGEAAIKETMAAGLVLLSNWRPSRAFIDPFCGTGTIAIEAALIGRNMAPGLARAFDAERWPAVPPEVWASAREEARAQARPALPITIHASDIDAGALGLARQHARAAGVERDVHFTQRDALEIASKAEHGVIVTNPPWGVRLGELDETDALYRALPLAFRRLPTWSFHILTARLDLERLFGQPATRRRKLYNSRIECTYFSFLGPKPPDMLRGPVADEPEPVAAAPDEPGLADELGPADEAPSEPEHAESWPPEAPPPPEPRAPAPPRAAGPAFGGLRERDVREAEQFRACLTKNVRHLRRYPSRGITCYRIYERDCPDTPLIIDRYEDWVHVAEYEREHSRSAAQQADWLDQARRIIADVCEVAPERVVMKAKHRQRGLSQHERVADLGRSMLVHEGGLTFEVNLTDYVDTGLFLDHRLTRAMVRDEARGKRVLNLFCYTGAFTVYAASGGAASSLSVDLSNTYLEWAARNLGHNRLAGAAHRQHRGDALEFLRTHPQGAHYDLAVVDPPTFSNSKSTAEDWVVESGQTGLFEALVPLMAPGGVIYFSNNFRQFKLDEATLGAMGVQVREITNRTIPPEYRNRRIHRCWRLVTPAAP